MLNPAAARRREGGGLSPRPLRPVGPVNSKHSMEQFIHKHRRIAFIARLYMAPPQQFERGRSGAIKMYLTHAEWRARERRRNA